MATTIEQLEKRRELAKLGGGAKRIAAQHAKGRLTAREDEVLLLMRRGMTNKQIAGRLDISVNTVKKHCAHVFAKHGLRGRRQQIA